MEIDFSDTNILIQYLKEGETSAYSYLVDTFYEPLCIYGNNLTRDLNATEDLVQNVLLKIWKNRSQLSSTMSIKSYLYKALYHEFISHYRKSRDLSPIDKKHIKALSELVEEQDEYSLQSLLTLVRREIESLPPKCKESFLLSKRDGLTNMEIAEYLQVSVKTVEAHIAKAYRILQDKIGDQAKCVVFLIFGSNKARLLKE